MQDRIDLSELKKIQINLLDVFHEYCVEHNLRYFITYGTLIGTIRHKGYIPWDDDIDVMMPRNDYEVLINNFNKDSKTKDIRVISHKNDTEYYLSFAKLVNTATVMKEEVNSSYQIGVYIDIFPLDNIGDDYKSATKLMRRAFRYNEIMALKNLTIRSGRSWYKNAILRAGRIVSGSISRQALIEKINSFGIKKDDASFTKYVGTVTGISAGDESRVFEAKWFSTTVKGTFEGKEYYIPSGYDAFLRKLYGDYMQLPPKEQQVSHHVFEAWYKSE